jgi:hypothetical protein
MDLLMITESLASPRFFTVSQDAVVKEVASPLYIG